MTVPTEKMEHPDRAELRIAAFRASKVYPGPVGELISRELMTWEEFGYRFDRTGLIGRLIVHVMDTPIPEKKAA